MPGDLEAVADSAAPPADPVPTSGVETAGAEEPPRLRPGEGIELPGTHIPPDPSVFAAKYEGVPVDELQVALIELVRRTTAQQTEAYAALDAAGREQSLPTPILDYPGSADDGKRVVANPYSNRIARVGTVAGSRDRMRVLVLEPSEYPEIYDGMAESSWLVEKLMAAGIRNPLAAAF